MSGSSVPDSRRFRWLQMQGVIAVCGRFLIENDADIEAEDVCGIRPLHHAARSGRTEVIDEGE